MGLIARYFVEAAGNAILADHWNGEFDNILDNLDPAHIDDASGSLADFQTTESPGTLGAELLPTTLEGEIRRLRYVLARLLGPGKEWYEEAPASFDAVPPVGSIIPFYDFGSAGPSNAALTFNANNWAYCDGSNANLVIGNTTTEVVLPDLSGRYLVGFGSTLLGEITTLNATPTAGGANYAVGDILTIVDGDSAATARVLTLGGSNAVASVVLVNSGAHYTTGTGKATSGGSGTNCTLNIEAVAAASDHGTAAWATGAVGQYEHTSDSIAHTHYTDIASTTSGSPNTTSITGGAHEHNLDNGGWAKIAAVGGGSGDILIDQVTATEWTSDARCDSSDQGAGATSTLGAGLAGATASDASHSHTYDHTHAVNPANTQSTSSLTTLSVQPESVQVRYLMRIE